MLSSFFLSLFAVLVAAVAQTILKKTAMKHVQSSFIGKIFNTGIICGYTLMLLSSMMNVIALKKLPLSLMPITEATGYFWIPLFSWRFLQKKPTKRNVIGACVIALGMAIFALGYI